MAPSDRWSVVDLFSGAGGASFGFKAWPGFEIVGAADAQLGKPTTPPGSLGCNLSYEANIGVRPVEADLAVIHPADLRDGLGLGSDNPTVLVACPPCTGFTRTQAQNHLVDDPRNSLVGRSGAFVEEFEPHIFVMENARELLMGRFAHHFEALRMQLHDSGYRVWAATHYLNEFGLPQQRERALVVAARRPLRLFSLSDLWADISIDDKATHVRRAIWDLPPIKAGERHPDDPMHVAPSFKSELTLRRIRAVPHDGGSWADLLEIDKGDELLSPAMARAVERREFGSYPDVYGRLWWDRPAVTIKRECAHVGNGRYSHPEQDRLCSVREMALLQGFPNTYKFGGTSVANMYRHIGDAVPPLISYQLAGLCEWILTGRRPDAESLLLPGTQIQESDLERGRGSLLIGPTLTG